MTAPLTFDEASHTYRLMGSEIPGVTRILRPLVDFSRIRPEVLAAKANLGRRVHAACQFLAEDDLDEESVEEDVAPYLLGYKRFLAETGASIIATEAMVCEPILQYAGTLDGVYDIDGHRWLIDTKTSITTPSSAGPQTAAYMRALGDTRVTRRAALRLRPDGTFRLDQLNDANDMSTFMACLAIYRHQERYPA